MSDSGHNFSDPRHPHERDGQNIAPIFDAEGRCLICCLSVANSEIDRLAKQKDSAYSERDKCVAAFVTLAHAMGWPIWLAMHEGEWEDDWRNIVFVETPYGQTSWHYHDSEREWFAWVGLVASPPKEWDGHSTPLKYERLHGLVHDGVAHPAVIELRRVLGHALRLTSEMSDWACTDGCESDAPGNSTCIDMGIDPCGHCKIGQAADDLEALLRGRKKPESLASEITAWGDATFPNSTEATVLAHLQAEAREELHVGCDPEEIADVAMLCIQLAHKRGLDLDSLLRAKLEKSKARTWKFDPALGFSVHVKP